jgi:hypothetical protein
LTVAVPPGVITLTVPDAAVPTTAVIVVGDTTLNEDAGTPPKLTVVVPKKLVPVMVTVAPAPVVEGVKELMVAVVCM